MSLGRAAIAVLSGALAFAGCDSEPVEPDAGPPEVREDAGPPVALGDIDVNVDANVPSLTGRLYVGAFLETPPTRPPLALARQEDPTFPIDVTLRGLEPGTYFVVGVVDYDPPSPTIPGPEDLTIEGPPVEVLGDDRQSLSLTFDIP